MTSNRLAVWAIPVAIVAAAVAHAWRVAEFGESPWIGAGFGMFAEIDGPQRVTELRLFDGEAHTIPSLSSEELERLSNFPSPRELEKFIARQDQVVTVSILRPVFSDDLRVTWEELASSDDS